MSRKQQSRRRRGSTDQHPLVVDAATSARLGRIRQRDTAAELVVRRIVYALGHRYRIRNRDLPGSPDLANRSAGWAIFVHGCFWHAHAGCPRATVPKRNRTFWRAKFRANRERDGRAVMALRSRGFQALTVWECESPHVLKRRLERFLSAR